MSVLARITEQTSVAFGPSSEEDVAALAALGMPAEIADFFRQTGPEDLAEIAGARLWPAEELVVENTQAVPGAYISPHGYVVIGTTEFGDTFCLDTASPAADGTVSVVLMPHEAAFDEMSVPEVARYRLKVAENFGDFLDRFAAGSLELTPDYPA